MVLTMDYSIEWVSEMGDSKAIGMGERNCEYSLVSYPHYMWNRIVLLEGGVRLVKNVYCKI